MVMQTGLTRQTQWHPRGTSNTRITSCRDSLSSILHRSGFARQKAMSKYKKKVSTRHGNASGGAASFAGCSRKPLEWRILLTSVTAVNPPANSHSAQVSTDIAATFDQNINPATATPQNFVVHSMQRGQLAGSSAIVSTAGATVTLNPTSDFFPGELVQTSVTSAIQSTGGQGADSHVWQLRTAVSGGSGEFSDSGQSLGNFHKPKREPG